MSVSEKDRKHLVDPVTLRASAEAMRRSGFDIVAEQLDAAAAEIEGGLESFTAVVAQKREAEAAKLATERNLRGAYDLIDEWRKLLHQLKHIERPDLYWTDWLTRIRRALREI